jgi:RimJ/RimL family protein N-acetyltransferase
VISDARRELIRTENRPTSELSPAAVAALLPDLPRWVEVRSLLLSGRGTVLSLTASDPPAFVARDPDDGQVMVIGYPGHDLIQSAAAGAREIWTVPESAQWTATALPGWKREPATIHVLGAPERLRLVPPGTVRLLGAHELGTIPELPTAFRGELLAQARRGTRIVAALAGDRPVAFCYASSVTERWWDVSIDTLEPFRRQGYAAQCVAAGIDRMAQAGKQPVWGAMHSNLPSARLAARLGFRPVDTLVLFSPPG